MDDVLLGFVIVSLIGLAVVVSGLLAIYSWYRIDHPISESYALLMTADSCWAGSYLLMIVGGGGLLTDVGLVAKALTSALAGVAWFLFVSKYTGDSEWIPTWVGPVLAAEAVLFGVVVAVNPGGLAITELTVGQIGQVTFVTESAGILTGIQLLISAGLVVISLVFLGRFFLQTQSVYRYQALIIFVTGVFVVSSSVLFVGEFRIHPLVDPTPILFNLQAVGVGWALYRYDFLKLAPVIVTRFFRDMTDPVLIVNAELVVADYNTSAKRLVDGLDRQLPIEALEDKAFSQALQHAITGTEGDGEFTKLLTDGGHKRTYDIEETEVADQFGIAQGYVIVLRDITDRKQRERRLQEQNKRLAEFADIVSHDLRNPLSTARGWSELVDRELASEEPDIETAIDGLTRVRSAHERMDELIDVLLTMAREGQTVDDPETVDLETCARKAWETADTGAMELVVETNQTIQADPTRLRQAFENLFRNANDHGTASTVHLTETPSGFAIEDDGKGIPAGERQSLFEFGYTTDETGTGIGLAIVKRIIEAHGWEISVADSEHGGARFEISIV